MFSAVTFVNVGRCFGPCEFHRSVVTKRERCSHSDGAARAMCQEEMRAKNSTCTYVALTSNHRVSTTCDFYCCLLPQCEALRACRSGSAIMAGAYKHRKAVKFLNLSLFRSSPVTVNLG